jgi:hypothetical protein
LARISFAAFRAALPRIVRSFFTENLPYKFAALFLSVVLWIVVERQTPRTIDENFDVLLVLRMDTSLVRVSPLPEVKARLQVPEADLLKLETDKPRIFLSFSNDVDDSVDVTIRPRDLVLPEGVRANAIAVEPASFVIRFDSLMQKTVPVRSALRITAGEGVAVAGAPRFEPDSVRIVGRRQTVAGIASVSTESIEVIATDTLPVTVNVVPPAAGISVAPPQVQVRVPIVRTQIR